MVGAAVLADLRKILVGKALGWHREYLGTSGAFSNMF